MQNKWEIVGIIILLCVKYHAFILQAITQILCMCCAILVLMSSLKLHCVNCCRQFGCQWVMFQFVCPGRWHSATERSSESWNRGSARTTQAVCADAGAGLYAAREPQVSKQILVRGGHCHHQAGLSQSSVKFWFYTHCPWTCKTLYPCTQVFSDTWFSTGLNKVLIDMDNILIMLAVKTSSSQTGADLKPSKVERSCF